MRGTTAADCKGRAFVLSVLPVPVVEGPGRCASFFPAHEPGHTRRRFPLPLHRTGLQCIRFFRQRLARPMLRPERDRARYHVLLAGASSTTPKMIRQHQLTLYPTHYASVPLNPIKLLCGISQPSVAASPANRHCFHPLPVSVPQCAVQHHFYLQILFLLGIRTPNLYLFSDYIESVPLDFIG